MTNNVILWKIHRILFLYTTIYNNFHNVLYIYLVHFYSIFCLRISENFSHFFKYSMKVITARVVRQPPLPPIWQLIGVAKVVHLKVIKQPRWTFLFLASHLDNGNNNNSNVCRYK